MTVLSCAETALQRLDQDLAIRNTRDRERARLDG